MALFPTAQNPNRKRKASLFSVLGGDVLNQQQKKFGDAFGSTQLPVRQPIQPVTQAAQVKPLVQQPTATTPQGKALVDAQNKVVTGQPVTNPPQAVGDQAAPAAVNLNAPATPPGGKDPIAAIKGQMDSFTNAGKPIPRELQARYDAALKGEAAPVFASMQGAPPQPTAAGGGPPPDSTVPSGETDASIQTGQPQNPYNPNNLFDPRHYDPQGNPSPQIKESMDFYNQAIAQPPASVQTPQDQAAWQQMNQRLLEQFAAELKQYPDQYGHLYENFRNRLTDAKNKWESQGKYNVKLDEMLAQQFPGLKVSVANVPEAQQNAFYQQAIAALQAGKSPQEIAGIYKSMFPAGYDFSIGAVPGATKENIDKYVGVGAPKIEQSGANIGTTDTSGINTTGQTQVGAQVTEQQRAELMKELTAQGYTDKEINSILAGQLQDLEADKQAAIRQSVAQASNSGFGQTLGAIVNATAGVAAGYDRQAAGLKGDLLKQGLQNAAERRRAAITGLGDVAAREAGIAGTQAQAGLGKAEIGSRENIAAGQLQLAKDSLFQEGQLTSAGQQINQSLQAYGFSLDKVLADQNFNLENFKNQLSERIANQTGNIEAAKIEADNITKSIQFAMDETQLDNQRNAQLAELQLRAAQGDQQAKLDVQQLQVEQELRGLGLENDYADRLGGWLMDLLQGREQLSQQNEQFLAQLREQMKQNNKAPGVLDIINSITGMGAAAVGIASGGR